MPVLLGGLPAHPLFVHLPVVLVPLAAIGALAMAVRPKWLRTFGPVVAALAGVGFIGAVIAASTGEDLQETLRAGGKAIPSALDDHAEMGDSAQLVVGVFFFLTLAWVAFSWWRNRVGEQRVTKAVRKPKLVAMLLAVLVVVSGVAATTSVTLAGHSGATSVWERNNP